MRSTTGVQIVGAAEAPYVRHPAVERRTETFIAEAVVRALADAGIHRDDVDGFGVASFSLAPDHAVDLAWKLGITARWLMEDTNGGASGINMLQHAVRAIQAGDAETVVLPAGDRMEKREFHLMTDRYNRVARDYLAPLPLNGPNALFSFLTQRYARKHDLAREDFACIPIAQRAWAGKNPGAVYRKPMRLQEYLDSAYVYDDYPVMVLAQLDDLGVIPDGDVRRYLHGTVLEAGWPLNTSGGQLSAGQAGAAGGMHGRDDRVHPDPPLPGPRRARVRRRATCRRGLAGLAPLAAWPDTPGDLGATTPSADAQTALA
jgi:acetyl-CoA acetyltransferase